MDSNQFVFTLPILDVGCSQEVPAILPTYGQDMLVIPYWVENHYNKSPIKRTQEEGPKCTQTRTLCLFLLQQLIQREDTAETAKYDMKIELDIKMPEIAQLCGSKWGSMSEEDKKVFKMYMYKPYVELSNKDKERYESEYTLYCNDNGLEKVLTKKQKK